MSNDFNIDHLRECLSYSPETGIITWLPRPLNHFSTERISRIWHTRFCGKEAGGKGQTGYIEIGMQGKLIKAHRAAWALYFGVFPEGDIDHINGVRDDNRICNLRDVDRRANSRNAARHKNNNSGISGVYWHVRDNRWVASINFAGMQRHLGYYPSLIDAASARKSAEIRFSYHENHSRN